ncbi:MAG: hypothetical protein M1812_002391 [Candelaria pacifica]|nr:MAG: hypothetical protein M1812_002391 [Candelaria pacifica]
MVPPTASTTNQESAQDFLLLLSIDDLVDPKVTRLISISCDLTFFEFHLAIQKAFQWQMKKKYAYGFSITNSHGSYEQNLERCKSAAAEFEGDSGRVGIIDPTPNHERRSLGPQNILIDAPLPSIQQLTSEESHKLVYKYGNNWTVQITLVGHALTENSSKIICFSGQGHPPDETLGGPSVWKNLVEKYETASSRKDKYTACKPFGKETKNKDPRGRTAAGPWNWDMGKVNSLLKRLSTANAKKRKRSASTDSEASSYYSTGTDSSQPPDRDAPDGNYIIRISLDDFCFPAVNRIISCPTNLTFNRLHQAIQISFDWRFYHAWNITLMEPRQRYGLPTMMISPGPSSNNFPWVPNQINCNDITLEAIYGSSEYEDYKLMYTYDFGDQWEHKIELLGYTKSISDDVVCVGGIGHPPGEDCGGSPGWGQLQMAYLCPHLETELEYRREWYEQHCQNGDPMGLGGDRLWRWDQDAVNQKLAVIYNLPDSDDANLGWLGPQFPPPSPSNYEDQGPERRSSEDEGTTQTSSPVEAALSPNTNALSPRSRSYAARDALAKALATKDLSAQPSNEARKSLSDDATQHAQQLAPPSDSSSKEWPVGAEQCLAGLSFVFTGILENLGREEGQELIKRYGGQVTTYPSAKTSYVVLGSDVEPKKLECIAKNNLQIINEHGLFELIRRLPANGGSRIPVEDEQGEAKERALD